jgi:hypothetical protein
MKYSRLRFRCFVFVCACIALFCVFMLARPFFSSSSHSKRTFAIRVAHGSDYQFCDTVANMSQGGTVIVRAARGHIGFYGRRQVTFIVQKGTTKVCALYVAPSSGKVDTITTTISSGGVFGQTTDIVHLISPTPHPTTAV